MICNNSPKAEPEEIAPEFDEYEQPATVKEEADRIEAILSAGASGFDRAG